MITGTDDFICDAVYANEIAASISDVQTVLVPKAGHFVYVERPVEFATAIARFLGAPALVG